MRSPKMILALSALVLLLAAYLIYSGAISLICGICLVGFGACVFGMLKLAGEGAPLLRKLLAGLLFLLSLACIGVFIWQANSFSDKWEGPDLKIKDYELARASVFASKLVDLASGSKALLLTPGKMIVPPPRQRGRDKKLAVTAEEMTAISKAQVAEVKRVFGSAIEVAGEESFPVIVLGDRFGIPRLGLSKETNAKAFEAAIQKHKDCNLVVSLVGLPGDTRAMTIWRWNAIARPKLAFMEGDLRRLSTFSTRGLIALYAVYKEGWTYTLDCPVDPQDAFSRRYMLVGDGNKTLPVPDPNKKVAAPAASPAAKTR